ncbi:hypothetical protein [Knoellia koreensis]|uniref:Uncharacterized protein n=1 Tax=Knoellia koreensis TaxID=2730921 RepID=A0A849HES5_9MICO|nr:hypothetical protein [Knoellia sp. DB2414S]NNM46435.1 hypothetical protein [Knoellia sp. DB2414S]
MDHMTSQQAKAQLAAAQATEVTTTHDRRVHGLATAGFGVAMGAYVAVQRVVDGTSAETPLLAVYAIALLGLVTWQTRAARSVPRSSRLVGYVGLAGSFVLMMATIMWLNIRGTGRLGGVEGQPESWGVLLLAGVVIALPMLVAGVRILRGGTR